LKLYCHFSDGDQYFYEWAAHGDVDYQAYWERFTEEPDKFVYRDMEEGLERMAESTVVLHVTMGILKSFYR